MNLHDINVNIFGYIIAKCKDYPLTVKKST